VKGLGDRRLLERREGFENIQRVKIPDMLLELFVRFLVASFLELEAVQHPNNAVLQSLHPLEDRRIEKIAKHGAIFQDLQLLNGYPRVPIFARLARASAGFTLQDP